MKIEAMMNAAKALWKNPAVKVAIVGALGATGGVMATGTLVINKATILASLVGAGTAIGGLFVQHPTKPGA